MTAKDNRIGTTTHLPSLGYKLMNVEIVAVTASNYAITILGLSSKPLQLILYYSSISQVIYFENKRIAHQRGLKKVMQYANPKNLIYEEDIGIQNSIETYSILSIFYHYNVCRPLVLHSQITKENVFASKMHDLSFHQFWFIP